MARLLGPPPAGQVCHGVGGAPGGPVSPRSGWLPAGDRVWSAGWCLGLRGQVHVRMCGARGFLGLGAHLPVFAGLGTAPLSAGDARCPWISVAMWCCVPCRCAARLDARSCRGLRGVPALDGAGASVVGVASAVCCWCGSGDRCVGGGGGWAGGRGGRVKLHLRLKLSGPGLPSPGPPSPSPCGLLPCTYV